MATKIVKDGCVCSKEQCEQYIKQCAWQKIFSIVVMILCFLLVVFGIVWALYYFYFKNTWDAICDKDIYSESCKIKTYCRDNFKVSCMDYCFDEDAEAGYDPEIAEFFCSKQEEIYCDVHHGVPGGHIVYDGICVP